MTPRLPPRRIAAGLLSLLLAGPACADDYIGFQSPTGNITCFLGSVPIGADGVPRDIVSCEIGEVKDVVLLGTVGSLVALLAVPALVAALRRWRASWLVRFAALGLVLSQLLFVRFPWKVPHLLPCLLCGAILLAVALADRPRLLAALAVLQLLSGVVRLDLVQPDNPNEATGGRVAVSVGWGPLVTDARCRHEHPGAYLGRQKVEVEQAWDCAKPFGG